MSKILEVENLNIEFCQDNKIIHAVKNISFSIKKGEFLAIVGESGAGKSVAAQSVMGLLPDKGTEISGSVIFNNKDLLKENEKKLEKIRGNKISFVFQEPGAALNPLHRIEKQIGEIIDLHQNISKKEKQKKVIELLQLVKIDDPKSKLKYYPHQLSGGQKQRVMIAMAVANKPDLLIADEPTTALDVKIQAQILELILELKEKIKMSVLLISHDLEIVKNFANRVCVMKNGKITETADTNKIFYDPKSEYTKHLVNAGKNISDFQFEKPGKTILKASNINVSYCLKKSLIKKRSLYFNAVKSASFRVNKKENLGIVGESGSGKSSLAMALLNLTPYKGDIIFNDKNFSDINKKDFSKLRKNIQVVFQDPYNSLNPRMTIRKIIGEGLEKHFPYNKDEHENIIKKILKDVGLSNNILNRYPHEFSGGERQRIAIARAVVLKPELIILDEPTSALDRSIQFQVIELLKKLQKNQSLTYIFISHDLKLVRSLCPEIIVMNKGKICEKGKTESVFLRPKALYTKELLEASFIQM